MEATPDQQQQEQLFVEAQHVQQATDQKAGSSAHTHAHAHPPARSWCIAILQ